MGRRRKNDLTPINPEDIIPEATDSEHMTDKMSVDDYIKIAEQENLIDASNKDIENKELKEKIEDFSLRETEYKSTIEFLNKEIESLKSNPNLLNSININVEKLIEENENLILKNSELEFDNVRLNQTIRNLQEEIQKLKSDKNHTYTKESYQNVKPVETKTRQITGRSHGYHGSMNGYQEWR